MDKHEFTSDEIAAGDALFSRPWQFLMSAPALDILPAADRPEIALAGRSNVGKSSLINALVKRHGLARTSNTPGRTQELNFFETPDVPLYLVDMPGYGFAEAPKAKVDAWTRLIKAYLRGRPTLARVLLLIDARHGHKNVDVAMMTLMDEAAVPYQVILTKVDKIKPAQVEIVLEATAAMLQRRPAAFVRVLATSSQTGAGMPEMRAEIAALAAAHGAR